jgi:hypothetical protein
LRTLPFALYESVALLAMALAFSQISRAQGRRRALVEITALAAYGLGLEFAAMRVFSSHGYARGWNATVLDVPLAVVAVWAALIPSSLALAARLGFASALGRGLCAAVVAIDLDLLMEPVAVAAGLWEWTPAGGWLGVPAGNFVGWAVIVGVYAIGTEAGGSHPPLVRLLARVLLGGFAITALVVVGALWQRMGMERLFAGWLAWSPWVLAIAASYLVARAPRPSAPNGPPGELAAAVLLLVAAAFSAQAVLLARSSVLLAALGAVLALGVVLRAATRAT